jgi:hypothetical protein
VVTVTQLLGYGVDDLSAHEAGGGELAAGGGDHPVGTGGDGVLA